jgi:hypothetical protein
MHITREIPSSDDSANILELLACKSSQQSVLPLISLVVPEGVVAEWGEGTLRFLI